MGRVGVQRHGVRLAPGPLQLSDAMADADARNTRLLEAVDAALAALDSLPSAIREASPDGVSEIEKVLAYARVIVENTDFDWTPSNIEPDLTSGLTDLAE